MFFSKGMVLRILALCLAFSGVGELNAQERGKPTLKAISLDKMEIQIDGRLDEAVWKEVERASGFIQQEPLVGEAAQALSSVRVAYDDHYLYIGAQLDDPNPEQVRGDERREDAGFDRSDAFAVIIDTYHDHQNGFFFESTPLSAMSDALVSKEGGQVNRDWDGKWTVAAQPTDRGWSVEFRIPFSTLRFRPGPLQIWGIQFRRRVPHLKEVAFWSPITSEQVFFEVSRGGHLTGINVAKQVNPLSIKPYAKGLYQNDRSGTQNQNDTDFDAGLDIRYRFRTNLALDLTYNTDFSETEVDRLQVNLTRFPLFFPEKREFFLEGKGFYDFGLSGRVQPFFSRRIGLVNRLPVPILAGGKLSGKVGPYGIGTLLMQTESSGDAPSEWFGVVRISRDIGLRSNVGIIATERRENSSSESETIGFDAALSPNQNFITNGFWAHSAGETGDERGESAFAEAEWRDPFWRIKLNHLPVDPNFSPPLRFVRQPDLPDTIRYTDALPQPEGGVIREIGVKTEMTYQTDASGEFLYQSNYNRIQADFRSGDFILLSVDPQRERLPEDFSIRPGIVIPSGTFQYTHYNIIFLSDSRRPLSGSANLLWGGFFDGRQTSLDLNFTVAPGEGIKLSGGWELDLVRLPQGNFNSQIASSDISWSLNNELLLQGLMQWDNESDSFAANFRLSWEYRESSWFYLIFNPTHQDEGNIYLVQTKITWLWEP